MAKRGQSIKNDKIREEIIDLTDYSQYGADNDLYAEYHRNLKNFCERLNFNEGIINIGDNKISSLSSKNFEHDIEKLIYELETGNTKYVSLSVAEQENQGVIVLAGLTESAVRQMEKDGIKPSALTKVGEDRYQMLLNVESQSLKELSSIETRLRARYTDGTKEEIALPGTPFKNGVGEIVKPLSLPAYKQGLFCALYKAQDLKEIIAQNNVVYKSQEQAVVKHATEKYVEKQTKNEVQQLIENSPVLTKIFEKTMGIENKETLAIGAGQEKLVEKVIDMATEKKTPTRKDKIEEKIEARVEAAVKEQGFVTKKELENEKKLSPAQKAAIVEEQQKNQQKQGENYLNEPARQIAQGEGNILGAMLEGMKKLAEWLVNLMVTSLVKMRGLSIQATQGTGPDMWQKKGTHSEQELSQERDLSQHMENKEAAQKMANEMGVKVSEAKKVVQNQQEQKKTVQFVQQEQSQEEEQGQGQGR